MRRDARTAGPSPSLWRATEIMAPPPTAKKWPASGKARQNQRRKAAHLAFVRKLSCVACGRAGETIQPAHVRTGTDGGMGLKPSDRHVVPLCALCHARQHRVGELTFWSALRIEPLDLALRLWTATGSLEDGEEAVRQTRLQIQLARHPNDLRRDR